MAAESQSASKVLAAFDASLDHFARLGLERRWRIDRSALEDGYLARAKQVHPDRHAGADAATRRRALEHSAALNEAYQILRDPVRRAEYLVKLGGVDLDSSDPRTGAPHPDQRFLIEMIERRERLEDVAAAGADALDELDQLDQLHGEVEDELERVFDGAVEALEAGAGDVRQAAAALVHRRYLQRFLDEIDAAAEAG